MGLCAAFLWVFHGCVITWWIPKKCEYSESCGIKHILNTSLRGWQKLTKSVSNRHWLCCVFPVRQYLTLQQARQSGARKATHAYCSRGITQIHTSKAGRARLPKKAQRLFCIHLLRPSKTVCVPARLETPHKGNWNFSPTQDTQ